MTLQIRANLKPTVWAQALCTDVHMNDVHARSRRTALPLAHTVGFKLARIGRVNRYTQIALFYMWRRDSTVPHFK